MTRPWEGELRPGWERKPFWSEFRRGKALGDGTEELLSVYRDYGVIPKASRDDNFNKPSEDLSKYQRVVAGDLVINKMKAWQGSLGVSAHDGIVSPAYFVYTATGSLNRRYAHYLLRSRGYADHMAAISSGIRPNQWDLDPLQLSATPLLVPPVAEQRAIADFLDRETAQIDAFIAKNEELITLLTERRTNTVRVATSVGVQQNPQVVDSGVAEIGKIAAGWRMMRLSLLFGSTGSGTTPPPEFVVDFDDADFPWVTTGELRETRITTTLRGISKQTLATTPALKLHPKGSLLLAMYGATIGRTAILDVDAASNQAVCALSRPRGCDVQFVEYALQASRERLILDAVGGGQPNINQEAVRAFRIPVPPLDEQHAIVRRIRDEAERTDEAIETARRGVELARERRAALISAAVTGRIDVGVSA